MSFQDMHECIYNHFQLNRLVDILYMSFQDKTTCKQLEDVLKMSYVHWE